LHCSIAADAKSSASNFVMIAIDLFVKEFRC